MTEEELFEILETTELENTSDFGQAMPEAEELNLDSGDILRIEEPIRHTWTGVTSCGHQDRIKNECWGRVQSWAKDKMFEYRQFRCLRYGNGSSRVKIRNRKDPWTGKRSCWAGTTIPCYIEFRKV